MVAPYKNLPFFLEFEHEGYNRDGGRDVPTEYFNENVGAYPKRIAVIDIEGE